MTTTDPTSAPTPSISTSIRTSIDALATMLSADGAGLCIDAVDARDPDAPAVELSLSLADLECEDCVMPPDVLRGTIAAVLARDTGAPVAVVLHDPRETAGTQARPPAATASRTGAYVVLDPTGVAPDDGEIDSGPDAGPLAGKTVAIRHDVLWPAFDWTVDEWTSLFEANGATVLAWPRAQGLKDDDLVRADAELEAMLAQADIALSGLANCGSCTSWSVRDALIAASKGLPVSVVATAHFEPLAHLLAAEGGRPGLRVTVLPYPYSTLDEATVREHARREFTQLLQVLGATVTETTGAGARA
jgi:hypothetical protein